MVSRIFQSSEPMPPKDNSPDVCRTALSLPEWRENLTTASRGNDYNSVQNVDRPRFGHKVE